MTIQALLREACADTGDTLYLEPSFPGDDPSPAKAIAAALLAADTALPAGDAETPAAFVLSKDGVVAGHFACVNIDDDMTRFLWLQFTPGTAIELDGNGDPFVRLTDARLVLRLVGTV